MRKSVDLYVYELGRVKLRQSLWTKVDWLVKATFARWPADHMQQRVVKNYPDMSLIHSCYVPCGSELVLRQPVTGLVPWTNTAVCMTMYIVVYSDIPTITAPQPFPVPELPFCTQEQIQHKSVKRVICCFGCRSLITLVCFLTLNGCHTWLVHRLFRG